MSEASDEARMRYSTAKDYVETIKLILTSPHYQGQHVGIAIRPTGLLLGFALELHFKAWLLADGLPSNNVSRLGHRLRDLYSNAIERGFVADDEIANLIDMIAEPHGQDRNFFYRYTRQTDELPLVPWSIVLPILEHLDLIVDTHTGASASHGLTPGH